MNTSINELNISKQAKKACFMLFKTNFVSKADAISYVLQVSHKKSFNRDKSAIEILTDLYDKRTANMIDDAYQTQSIFAREYHLQEEFFKD